MRANSNPFEGLRKRVAKDSLPKAHALLMKERKKAEELLAEISRLREQVEQQAVDQGIGVFVPGPQRELAPSKDEFIRAFGIEMWRKMRRISAAGKKFVWASEVARHG